LAKRLKPGDAHYVNNKDLHNSLCEWKSTKKYKIWEKKRYDPVNPTNDSPPALPDFVGECILKICTRLATKPNFSGYTYKDDMIGDAIENILRYIHKYNPDKSNNPFSYITQIAHFAFIRRIKKEHKQETIKFDAISQAIHNKDIRDHLHNIGKTENLYKHQNQKDSNI